MKYHPVKDKIVGILEKEGVWFETFEHEPVRTSQEAAKIRTGYSLSQGAKALILKVKQKESSRYIMLVVSGDKKFDGKKVKDNLIAKDIRFATGEEIAQLTGGVEIGGVPPFGNLFDISMIVDKGLFINEKIIFNAGDRSFSIAMKSDDYKKILNPVVEEIAK